MDTHFANLQRQARDDSSITEALTVILNNPFKIRKEFFESEAVSEKVFSLLLGFIGEHPEQVMGLVAVTF